MKFVKGQSGNLNGRPTGAVNVTTRLVKDVFAEVFNQLQENPETSLKTWAEENRRDFYALVTKLIPVQLDHAGEVIQRLIIQDTANCKPLEDDSNPGIQSEPKSLPLPQLPGNS